MKYRVLVVDDQSLPRQLFENIIINSEHYTLAGSIDRAELSGLYCARGGIDLILMDVVMQDGISGLEAAARIKKSYPAIRIIIVTSMADMSFIEKAKAAGVDSFWYKEVQDKPMLEIMDRTMAGEHVYPDMVPVVKLGLTTNIDLTDRELDVLRLLVSGYTDKEIAEKLSLSYHTVRFHMNNMITKTGCNSRTDLAIRAVRSGIVVPEL